MRPSDEITGAYIILTKYEIGRTFLCKFPYTDQDAIFSLRPQTVFLSHSFYDMSGLAPHMGILFIKHHDFPITLSNMDSSRNA